MKKYRNEWKFICTDCNLEMLLSRIKTVLKLDSHANQDGSYYIHTLYFDDYKNICAKNNDSGSYKRFKWRIRYYNKFDGLLFLEKKEKLLGRCHKKQCKISKEQYLNIINGNVMQLFWDTDEKLLKEFCLDITNKRFSPKVIIDYERIAYVDPVTNIRVTLDRNISSAYDINKFLVGKYVKFPLQEKNYQVLEVKFDYILPGHIKNLVCSYGFNQTSFSKYYLGRKVLSGVLK